MNIRRSLALSVAVGSLALAAKAAPVTQVLGSASGAAYNRQVGQATSCSYLGVTVGICSLSSVGILPQNSSNFQSWIGLPNAFGALVHSEADDQGLHAFAQIDVTGYPVDFNTPANNYGSSYINTISATANYFDTLTLNGPGSAPISVDIEFAIDGVVYAFGAFSNAYADVAFLTTEPGMFNWQNQTTWRVGNPLGSNVPVFVVEKLRTTLALTPGQSVKYALSLKSTAAVSDNTNGVGPHLSNKSAYADFGSTLQFSDIAFHDGNGTALSNYSLSSTSGWDYGQFTGVATPEPSTGFLAGGALLLATLLARRTSKPLGAITSSAGLRLLVPSQSNWIRSIAVSPAPGSVSPAEPHRIGARIHRTFLGSACKIRCRTRFFSSGLSPTRPELTFFGDDWEL